MNSKNAILCSLFGGVLVIVVGLLIYVSFDRQQLEETLHEKEESLTSLGKTLDEALIKIDELDEGNKKLVAKTKELDESLNESLHNSEELKAQVSKLTTENTNLANANKELQKKYTSLQGNYETLKKNKAIAAQKAKNAGTSYKKETIMPSRSNNQAATKEFYVEATAYTAYCTGCSGITATGINLRANPNYKLIAVDPKIIPLGSRVWVEGYGYAVAGDTGGAIKGYKIDLFMSSKQAAYKWGRKKVRIKVL